MKINKSRVGLFLLLVILVAVAWAVRRGSRDTVPSAEGTYEFSSMDRYLQHEAARSNHQVVFIGMDGATWDIMDPMIEAGLLPTIARLKSEGAWGVLRSVDCYISPPAWTSMMTGYSPQRTGVYTFGQWLPDEKRFKAFSSLDVQVPFVWDIASKANRRVAITNVPATYPARPVNGVMVSGLMTPLVYRPNKKPRKLRFKPLTDPFDERLDANAYGPRLSTSIVYSMNTFTLVLYDTKDDAKVKYDTVALKITPTDKRRKPDHEGSLYTFPINRFSPFFTLDYRVRGKANRRAKKAADKKVVCSVMVEQHANPHLVADLNMTPLLRLPTDPELTLTYPETFAQEIEDEFGYYLVTLGYSGDLAAQGAEWTTDFASYFYEYDDWDLFAYVFTAPDNIQHREGVTDNTRAVYQTIDRFLAKLIDDLPDDVTLILASDHGFAEYDYVVSLNDYLEEIGVLTNARKVEHDRTLVFHNQWCLYFNDARLSVAELVRLGIPIPKGKSPREALVAYLQSKCDSLMLGERRMPIQLVEVPVDAAGNAPDMVVIGSYTDYFIEGQDMSIQSKSVIRETGDRMRWFHHRDGFYLLWGDKLRSGYDGGTKRIEDMTPTILYLLDLPLAKDFDGNVMEDLFRRGTRAHKPLFYIDDYADQSPDKDYTYEELQSLEEKLKTLGYIN